MKRTNGLVTVLMVLGVVLVAVGAADAGLSAWADNAWSGLVVGQGGPVKRCEPQGPLCTVTLPCSGNSECEAANDQSQTRCVDGTSAFLCRPVNGSWATCSDETDPHDCFEKRAISRLCEMSEQPFICMFEPTPIAVACGPVIYTACTP